MREIKFRVWDKIRNEMFSRGEIYINLKGNIFLDIIDNNTCEYRFDIMQYTGLKDKNGKEIYEGDIIKTWRRRGKGYKENRIEEVRYSEILARYMPYDIEVLTEIIGNKYENPELKK